MTAVLPASVGHLRERAEPLLRASVSTLHPRLARVVAYHRGWADAEGRALDAPTGKALRPALALLAGRAAGGPLEPAAAAAVAVEMVHDFSLLHDDVMDGDTERRHRPTAWVVFGVADAILAGDALLCLATRVVQGADTPRADAGVALLHQGVARLVDGQAMDVDFETRGDVELAECVTMAAGKTAALLRTACSLGALLAGGSPRLVDGLGRFGEELGVAFQVVDDLLGIWGDPASTGKPVLSDLRRRKKSLPVVAALGAGGPAARALADFLASAPGSGQPEPDLVAAAALVESCGGRAWAQAEAGRRLAAALTALDDLTDEGAVAAPVAAELAAVARFTVERSS